MEWKSEKKVSCFLCVHVNGKVHVHGYIGNNRNRMNDDHMKRRGRGRKLWTSKNKMINISVINCDLIVLQMIELKRVEKEFVVEVFISLISFFRRRCFFFFLHSGLNVCYSSNCQENGDCEQKANDIASVALRTKKKYGQKNLGRKIFQFHTFLGKKIVWTETHKSRNQCGKS